MRLPKKNIPKTTHAALLAAILFTGQAAAGEMDACFSGAAKTYHIDRTLLVAIGKHESRLNPNAVHQNKDGSYDYGVMQINSRHLPKLNRVGITKKALFDPCTNIYVGAWILSKFIKHHGATWRAVGAYNAGSVKNREQNREKYATQIRHAYSREQQERGAS